MAPFDEALQDILNSSSIVVNILPKEADYDPDVLMVANLHERESVFELSYFAIIGY